MLGLKRLSEAQAWAGQQSAYYTEKEKLVIFSSQGTGNMPVAAKVQSLSIYRLKVTTNLFFKRSFIII